MQVHPASDPVRVERHTVPAHGAPTADLIDENLRRALILRRPFLALALRLVSDGDTLDHAWALSPGVRQLAAAQDLGFKIYTKPGCPPLSGVSVVRRANPVATEACARFNASVMRRLTTDNSIKWVIISALWDNPVKSYVEYPLQLNTGADGLDLLSLGLGQLIVYLQSLGLHVILMGDTPYFTFDPYRVALASSLPMRQALFCALRPDCHHLSSGSVDRQYVRDDSGVDATIKKIATRTAATYFDTERQFCNTTLCRFNESRGLLFLDSNHVSKLGASEALAGLPLFRP